MKNHVFFFSAGGSLAFLPVNSFSQPGRKAVPGDLFSEAVFSELGWTSGTQLTGEGWMTEDEMAGWHHRLEGREFE